METEQMKKVIVYSTPACPFCVLVKNFLKQNKVEFQEVDISVDTAAERILKKAGVRSVPITEIDGEIVIGYDIPKIKALLGFA